MKKKKPMPLTAEEEKQVQLYQFKKFFENIDWKELKKQRRSVQVILEGEVLPKKEKEALEGLQNLLEDMAFFVVDNLGVPKSTLLTSPENLSSAKQEAWEAKDNEAFTNEVAKFIEGVQKNL